MPFNLTYSAAIFRESISDDITSWASYHYLTHRKFRRGKENIELKKTTTATVTASSLNKSFNEKNTFCAGALCVSSNISLPPSGKQREMTKFCVVWRM